MATLIRTHGILLPWEGDREATDLILAGSGGPGHKASIRAIDQTIIAFLVSRGDMPPMYERSWHSVGMGHDPDLWGYDDDGEGESLPPIALGDGRHDPTATRALFLVEPTPYQASEVITQVSEGVARGTAFRVVAAVLGRDAMRSAVQYTVTVRGIYSTMEDYLGLHDESLVITPRREKPKPQAAMFSSRTLDRMAGDYALAPLVYDEPLVRVPTVPPLTTHMSQAHGLTMADRYDDDAWRRYRRLAWSTYDEVCSPACWAGR